MAILLTLVSVGAAYGVLVAVFQWGWLGALVTTDPQIDTITPPLVLAVAFGLSIDYQFFLLTRIREEYTSDGGPGSTARAIATGLTVNARIITGAALIMVVVFLAFVGAGAPSIQRIGLATAAAVAIDATIVRMVLLPALMTLLGRWNWWIPRWLDTRLPDIAIDRVTDEQLAAVLPGTPKRTA